MEFRLTYAGELYATQRDPLPGQPPRHTPNRQHIRRLLYVQLKKLWESIVARQDKVNLFTWTDDLAPPAPPTTIAELSAQYAMYGFQFVPLVTQELDLICEEWAPWFSGMAWRYRQPLKNASRRDDNSVAG
jgi:hypothetical protein